MPMKSCQVKTDYIDTRHRRQPEHLSSHAAAHGLTSFATMQANCSILMRDAEKAIIK